MKTCPHLAPLERELAAQSIALGDARVSPYGESAGHWCACECTFDAPALRTRLALPACVNYDEYDGRVAGSDATFFCTLCKRAIMGLHPHYAKAETRRLA
ncbi:MAG: hypothetical protein ABIR80_13330 [Opitutaceae bacterium]